MAQGKFEVEYSLGGKDAYNIGYVITDAAAINEWQQVVDNISANWAANIMPSMSNDLTMVGVSLLEIDGVIAVDSQQGNGTIGGTVRPAESILSSVCITKADSTSRYKGRWFIPGVPDSEVSAGGVIGPAWGLNLSLQFQVSQTNLNPVFNSFLANRHSISGLPGQFAYAAIESFGYVEYVAVQERRRF